MITVNTLWISVADSYRIHVIQSHATVLRQPDGWAQLLSCSPLLPHVRWAWLCCACRLVCLQLCFFSLTYCEHSVNCNWNKMPLENLSEVWITVAREGLLYLEDVAICKIKKERKKWFSLFEKAEQGFVLALLLEEVLLVNSYTL